MDSPSVAAIPITNEIDLNRRSATRGGRIACVLFLIAFGTSAWFARHGWSNAVLDTHGFRQTQTAISTYWMQRDGFRLDYATPVVGAPWSIPYEFPVYQAIVAAVSRAGGWAIDPTGRAVSLTFFYLSLPAIWLLLKALRVAPASRWMFLALVVSCPEYLFYSRAVLIESTAFCFSVWFLWLFSRALSRPSAVTVLAAALCGVAAGATKATTFAVFLVPAMGMLYASARGGSSGVRRALAIRALLTTLPGIILTAWWVHYTDVVKQHNVFGRLQTTAALHEWNYGTIAQRVSAAFWQGLNVHLQNALLPASSLLILAVLLVAFGRQCWRAWLGAAALALVGPLVFANLYFVHDYYFYANGVFVLVLLALPLQKLLEATAVPLALRMGVVVVVLASQFHGYLSAYHTAQAVAAPQPPPLARAIEVATAPDDVLFGWGLNWSPIYAYYSHRRALMVPDAALHDEAAIREAVQRLRPARVGAAIVSRSVAPNAEAFKTWLDLFEFERQPVVSNGDYFVYVRRDRLTAALQALRTAKIDVFLYDGHIGKPGVDARVIFAADQVADRSLFAHMHPAPSRIIVPTGLSQEPVAGRLVFNAPASTDLEIPAPAGARRLHASFGVNPAAYGASDGVEFEITFNQKAAGTVLLYRRFLQPWLLKTDQGLQTVDLEWNTPLDGTAVFRTRPGPANNPNSDWSYWAEIDIR